MDSFIIENAINTCYIDSLLMSLLYKSTSIDTILSKDLKDATAMYLQEYIKERFVNSIRNNKSVLKDDIEMIRVMCSHLGWQNHEEYINQQDVTDFYCFLMDTFEIEKISIQRNTVTETGNNLNNLIGEKELIPYIPLHLSEMDQAISVKNMISQWQFDNISTISNNINIQKNACLNSYHILNSPSLIGMAINRFNNNGTRIQTSVIIQKKICIGDKKTTEWLFHAAICHRGNTIKSGHYYALLSGNDSLWYIFDDSFVPCIQEVRMDDANVTNIIKKECIFLLYRK